jgi:hypothetical protein
VNLADALGIVPWQSIDGQVNTPQRLGDVASRDVWCMAEGLEDFWIDASDPRWHLLLAILKSVGHNEETVAPLDRFDDYPEGVVLAFGLTADTAICLPSLDAMLNSGIMKQQAWQVLCDNRTLLSLA